MLSTDRMVDCVCDTKRDHHIHDAISKVGSPFKGTEFLFGTEAGSSS